ncbi:MAG: hypothetical protein GY761_19185 [Hyphomicrobiales bacterium]|nr:hypothetical protein [Hyphomicrobiales bacterium]
MIRTKLLPAFLILATISIGAAIGNFGSSIGVVVQNILELGLGKPVTSATADWKMDAVLWSTAIWLLVAGALLWLVSTFRAKFFPLRAHLRRNATGNDRKVVILGLSHGEIVTSADGQYDIKAYPFLEELTNAGFEKASRPVRDMIDSGLLSINPGTGRPERSAGSHTWVQNLRAIRDHLFSDKLSIVVVCPSSETIGQAELFKEFLEKMIASTGKDWVSVLINKSAPSYNDFEALRDALEHARIMAIETGKRQNIDITDKDICIDATAGTVTFSVAVGIVTLNHDMQYSYVTTYESGENPSGGEVRYYDTQVDFATFIPEN